MAFGFDNGDNNDDVECELKKEQRRSIWRNMGLIDLVDGWNCTLKLEAKKKKKKKKGK